MLNADSQGFLIGEVLDVSKSMLRGQQAGLEALSRIDSNLSSLIGRSGRIAVPRTRSVVVNAVASEPAGRRATVQIGPYGQPVPKARASSPSTGPVTAPSARDARGRFVARGSGGSGGGGAGGAGGGDSPSPEPRSPDEARSSGDSRLVEAIKDVARETTDRMDPMIEAAKEVWEPLGRGWRASFGQGAEKKKERWYKRILQAITRKKDGGEATAAASSGGGGMLSGIASAVTGRLSGLAGMIPTLLSRVFAPVAAAWAGWEVGQWIGGKVHDWLVSSGLQDKMFDWIDSMRAGWSSMLDRLSKVWDEGIKKPVKEAWNNTTEFVGNAANSFASSASSANSWLADKTGVNVGAGVKAAGGALGKLIGRHEGNYDSFNRGVAGDSKGKSMDFANMTIAQIMALQALPAGDASRLFAVGKYQVTPSTLREAVKTLGIGQSEKLTPELQERIFSEFLVGKKRRAVSDFRSGKSNDIDAAVYAISQEFASVQNPYTGRGYYDGKAGNRASLSADAVRSALMADRIPATASIPTVSIPSIRNASLIKPIAAAPDISFPSLGVGDAQPIRLSIPDQLGQNVSDRSIAHITTGGLGGGG